MLPDRVSNPGPLTYESGALPTVLHGPAPVKVNGELTLPTASLLNGINSYMKYFAPIKANHDLLLANLQGQKQTGNPESCSHSYKEVEKI